MAPQRPLYHRFAWAFDLVVPDASAARVRRLAALLGAYGVRPPARILDAGCGTGNYARALARLGYRVVGVDRSVRLLADARAKTVAAGPVFVRAAVRRQSRTSSGSTPPGATARGTPSARRWRARSRLAACCCSTFATGAGRRR